MVPKYGSKIFLRYSKLVSDMLGQSLEPLFNQINQASKFVD
jgi:hypothetical protein